MASGDDELATSLGINPGRTRITMCLASVFMTAAVISFNGSYRFLSDLRHSAYYKNACQEEITNI